MSETVRKFLWVEPIDMDHFEGWLEDMARKGLHYHHSGPLFVHFRRGEPGDVRFRLEPAGSLWSRESQNYCRSLGWERLGEIGRDLELYRNADPEAPDLHTDPVVRSYGLEQLAKLIKRRAVVIALCLAVFVAAVLSPLFLLDFPVESFLTGSATVLFALVLEVLAMASSLRALASFFALRRRLREGVPSRRDGSWRRVAAFNMALTPVVTWKYQETDETVDPSLYTTVNYGKYTFPQKLGMLYAQITAPQYPGVELRTTAVHVASVVGIGETTADNSQPAWRITAGNLSLTATQTTDVKVYDAQGRLVVNTRVQSGNHSWNLPAGIYIANGVKLQIP